ncbi:MAG TPA: non-ribosomal peptide synthetase, partial [Actinomycetota bacterium]|nr:non-ribosomal peptide synthetase [Actinomycetota bacterium]
EVAGATPGRVAATFEDRSITYGELNAAANRLAHLLRRRGSGPERVVGVMFEKGLEMLVGLFGAWKAGAAFVPLDADVPADRCSLMLERCRADLVVTVEKFRGIASALEVHGRPVEVVTIDSTGVELEEMPAGDPPNVLGPKSLAYVIFTSGSTGTPKGVMVEHGGLVNMTRFAIETYHVHPGSRFLQFMSITFDAFLSEMLPALTTGATLSLGRRDELLPGPSLAAFLRDRRITNVLLTPSALALVEPQQFPDLETLIVCGEACPPELAARWSGGRTMVNAYGPTEITCFCHAATVVADGKPPPIGVPMANIRSYVLDDNLEPVPLNVRGELYVGAPGLARGYLDRPDLTAERFLPDPFTASPGDRMYRTGDVVRCRRDGQIEFFGRSDAQVKIRGFRVEPGEIEAAVLEHPGIAEAVVVARDESGGKRLVCYYAARDPAPTVAELRSFLARKLPAYMVPAAFVSLAAIPHSASGKVDRRALPDPPSAGPDISAGYTPPATSTEEMVADAWRHVLGIERPGVTDKFFDVGGNSLKIVELSERLHKAYPGALSVAELFEHTTVRDMAAVIDDRLGAPDAAPAVVGFEL